MVVGLTLSFPLKTVISVQEADIGDGVVMKKGTSLKIGDRFKDKQTGKIYVLKMTIDRYTVLLEGENGMGRRITDEENLRRTCDNLEAKES
jgi:hypothetical protein